MSTMGMVTGIAMLVIVNFCLAHAEVSIPPTEGLAFWLDASETNSLVLENGFLKEWKSRNVDGSVFTSTDGNHPRFISKNTDGVRETIRFDGIDDYLINVAVERKSDEWTLISLIAPFSPCRGGGICSACPTGGNDYDPGFTLDLYNSNTKFDQINVEGAGRIGGQIDIMKDEFCHGGMRLVIVIRHKERVILYIDGKYQGERSVALASTNMTELRIGARHYDGRDTAFFHGDIALVMLYLRAIGEEERRAIESAYQVSETEKKAGESMMSQMNSSIAEDRMKQPVVIQTWPNRNEYATNMGNITCIGVFPFRTDIREAAKLSVMHLCSLFDKDRDNEPFFYLNRNEDGTGKMHHSVNIGVPHVVGRCLLGGHIAEKYMSIPFPEEAWNILEHYCKESFNNDDNLNSYIDPAQNGLRIVEFHNMREGLYALWALIDGRKSGWASDKAHKMLITLDKITDENGCWSPKLVENIGASNRFTGLSTPNAARMVEPLLAYYDCSKDSLALKLAEKYAKNGLEVIYTSDGHFASMDRSSGHIHSITSSLSGITAFAIRINDKEMMDKCEHILEEGVPEYFSSWGWGDEVYPEHPADVISRGEINQTGDIIRTALMLAESGRTHYYDLAERYIRGMLLPVQHREKELGNILRENPHPSDDSERDIIMRSIGGYAMQLPNDRMRAGDWPISTLDITSGAVHALSEAFRQNVSCKQGVYAMNMGFGFEDLSLRLVSGLPAQGKVTIEAKKNVKGLRIRIPTWVDTETIRLEMNGAPVPVQRDGAYIQTGQLKAGTKGFISYELPCKVEKETVDHTEYTTTWIGNQIIDITPRGTQSPLPF